MSGLVTTPTEKEFYDALSPDLKKKVDEQRKLTQGARDQLARDSQTRLQAIKVCILSLCGVRMSTLIQERGSRRKRIVIPQFGQTISIQRMRKSERLLLPGFHSFIPLAYSLSAPFCL